MESKKWEYKEVFSKGYMEDDYNGHYEVTNGEISLCTNDDPEDITETENTLQRVANVLNESGCKFYCNTTTEHKLHIENMQLRSKYDDLKEKYDNILATESGHESKTENVWQSGYATGHEAASNKHKQEFERIQKSAIHYANRKDEVEKERDELKERSEKMEHALEDIARQKKSTEWEEEGDTERGYDCIIEVAREALAKEGKEVEGDKTEHRVSIGEWITYCKGCGFPVAPIDECNCIDKGNKS